MNKRDFVFSNKITGLNKSTKPRNSSKRLKRNQQSKPRIHTNRNKSTRTMTRDKMNIKRTLTCTKQGF